MARHVVVLPSSAGPTERSRAEARDGWRVFRSKRLPYEIAIPAYQISRVEAIATAERDEWHALVVGDLLRDADGNHLVVRDMVPNEWAERGRALVKISAAAEAKVRELARSLHPTLIALGIIHTHPGFTVRPSQPDRDEFWSDPNCVSIIVDPFNTPKLAVYRGPEGERLEEVTSTPIVEGLRVPIAFPNAANQPSAATSVWSRVIDSAGTFLVTCALAWGIIASVRDLSEIKHSLATISHQFVKADAKGGAASTMSAKASLSPLKQEDSLMCTKDGP